MIGDLFDSPWKLLIIAAVILVLFGSRKLPDAARSLGRSMRILKSEVQGMHGDDDKDKAAPQAAEYGTAQQPQPAIPQQLTASAGSAGDAAAPVTEAQRTGQPG
ncbi:MAG TPA: Sec-independent protein translocase subunit TatA [Streptosporangiaceae bacterium]|nr:Sec-independent protein translocase subunit TatA [Streptosporangiaceae bacterium]